MFIYLFSLYILYRHNQLSNQVNISNVLIMLNFQKPTTVFANIFRKNNKLLDYLNLSFNFLGRLITISLALHYIYPLELSKL